jgi:hypothetical protein
MLRRSLVLVPAQASSERLLHRSHKLRLSLGNQFGKPSEKISSPAKAAKKNHLSPHHRCTKNRRAAIHAYHHQ